MAKQGKGDGKRLRLQKQMHSYLRDGHSVVINTPKYILVN